ncbi:YdgA family protein [Achromobacter mucicolens]|uniref:YdgA family protein n=1 Tax=Achromobacter mucicolens TaxID=1389922 RepID=UPI0022F38671|nr:DUF945 family protein [Achromobacter mucicolens]WBX88544.1 DUF945 family protein [Achromobacter mucicolens]
MNKRIVAGGVLVAAVAAAWVGTAWYTGKQIEARLAQDVQALNAQAQRLGAKVGVPVTLELLSFERGVFSSEARFGAKVTVQSGPKPAEKAFAFASNIEHGPFPASRLASGDVAPVMAAGRLHMTETPDAAAWFAAAGGSAPVTANFLIAYDRDFSGDLALAPVKYAADPITFDFSGLQAQVEHAGDGTRDAASFAVGKVALSEVIKGTPNTVTLDELAVSHQVSSTAASSTSSSTLTAKKWTSDMDKLPLGLKDIALTLGSDGTPERMTGKMTLDVGSISVRGLHVAKLRMAAGGKDMDVASLKAFQEATASAPMRGEKADPLSGDGMLAASHLLKFLLARPSFTLSTLQVDTARGTSSLSLDIGLDSPSFWKRDSIAIIKEVVRNVSVRLKLSPENMADLIAARAELKGATREAARSAAEREAAGVRGLVAATPWGRIEDGVIQFEADYRDGQVDINGKRMPIEVFVSQLFMRGSPGADPAR